MFNSRREDDATSETEWFPADYNPGLSVENWVALLGDEEVFRPGSLEIMKRLKDFGGTATCTQLSMKYGVFYRFCQKAANHPDKDYFFIIDEINRGNLSKIFGELLLLIECGYRDTKIMLAYNELAFFVPSNLYIIGMMNTADRSLAMMDYALRRRFSFFDMEPGFDSEGFLRYQNGFDNDIFHELISRIKDLNVEITRDKSLGKGFCIGHSYFCGKDVCTEEWLRSIVDYDILPMLSEYWFDDAERYYADQPCWRPGADY